MPEVGSNQTELLTNLAISGLIILAACFVFYFLRRAVDFVARTTKLSDSAMPVLQMILRLGLVILTAALVGSVFKQNIFTGLVTVAGLVAIGFVAVWSILSNVLCTFVLILFKPFAIGDEVEFPAESVGGKVVDLSLMYTTLKTSDGAFVQIPNNMFFQKIFKRRVGTNQTTLEDQLGKDKPAA